MAFLTVAEEPGALPLPWRFPATLGAEVTLFGFDTGVVTGCLGTAAALEACVPLPVVLVALPCACLPLDVLFAAVLACAASS